MSHQLQWAREREKAKSSLSIHEAKRINEILPMDWSGPTLHSLMYSLKMKESSASGKSKGQEDAMKVQATLSGPLLSAAATQH